MATYVVGPWTFTTEDRKLVRPSSPADGIPHPVIHRLSRNRYAILVKMLSIRIGEPVDGDDLLKAVYGTAQGYNESQLRQLVWQVNKVLGARVIKGIRRPVGYERGKEKPWYQMVPYCEASKYGLATVFGDKGGVRSYYGSRIRSQSGEVDRGGAAVRGGGG